MTPEERHEEAMDAARDAVDAASEEQSAALAAEREASAAVDEAQQALTAVRAELAALDREVAGELAAAELAGDPLPDDVVSARLVHALVLDSTADGLRAVLAGRENRLDCAKSQAYAISSKVGAAEAKVRALEIGWLCRPGHQNDAILNHAAGIAGPSHG